MQGTSTSTGTALTAVSTSSFNLLIFYSFIDFDLLRPRCHGAGSMALRRGWVSPSAAASCGRVSQVFVVWIETPRGKLSDKISNDGMHEDVFLGR